MLQEFSMCIAYAVLGIMVVYVVFRKKSCTARSDILAKVMLLACGIIAFLRHRLLFAHTPFMALFLPCIAFALAFVCRDAFKKVNSHFPKPTRFVSAFFCFCIAAYVTWEELIVFSPIADTKYIVMLVGVILLLFSAPFLSLLTQRYSKLIWPLVLMSLTMLFALLIQTPLFSDDLSKSFLTIVGLAVSAILGSIAKTSGSVSKKFRIVLTISIAFCEIFLALKVIYLLFNRFGQ